MRCWFRSASEACCCVLRCHFTTLPMIKAQSKPTETSPGILNLERVTLVSDPLIWSERLSLLLEGGIKCHRGSRNFTVFLKSKHLTNRCCIFLMTYAEKYYEVGEEHVFYCSYVWKTGCCNAHWGLSDRHLKTATAFTLSSRINYKCSFVTSFVSKSFFLLICGFGVFGCNLVITSLVESPKWDCPLCLVY